MCFTTLRSIRAKESIKPVEKKEVRIIFRTPSILPKPTKSPQRGKRYSRVRAAPHSKILKPLLKGLL